MGIRESRAKDIGHGLFFAWLIYEKVKAKMKICFVGPADSAHMKKWCNWFSNNGHEVHVISFVEGNIPSATVHVITANEDGSGSDLSKIRYLLCGRKIKKVIREIEPDIVNVHYATSYGASIALSGLKGYFLSVWGKDIYEFPRKSVFHKLLLEYSLNRASHLFSTSLAMANEAAKYTNQNFTITPFGVDMNLFNPDKRRQENEHVFTVGTVKSLSDKYGIRNILEAVAKINDSHDIKVALRIAGDGPQKEEYQKLSINLGIDRITTWLGYISQEEAAKEWANMDIAIIPSTVDSESFGVSAVEAQACGTAMIISDIPGLMEVADGNAKIIKRNDTDALVDAIEQLYYNKELRKKLGQDGRENVLKKYDINDCFQKIESYYEEHKGELA